MSGIIDYLIQSDLDHKINIPYRSSFNFQSLSHTLNSLSTNSQSIKYFRAKNQKYEIVQEINLYKHLPTIIKKIIIDRRKMTYQSKFILKIQSNVLCCLTKQLRLLLVKEIEAYRKKIRVHANVTTVDQNSGEIIIKQIFALSPQTNLNQLLTFQIMPIKTSLCRLITAILNLINISPPLYLQFLHQSMKTFNQINVQQKIQYRAYKYFYYNIISYWASLTDSTCQSYQYPQDRELFQRLCNEKKDKFQEANIDLYTHLPKIRAKNSYKFEISPQQQNNFRIHLKVPNCQSKKSQSNFIFNQIMVIQESNQAADSGLRGAKTKILLTKLKFYYHNGLAIPHQNHNNKEIVRKQYTKLVAIKVPIQKTPTQKQRNKQDHQIKILKIFSMKQSPFLLRYYVCPSPKFKYNNMLMMNFVGNCDTISSFFNNRRETMSLTSKLFILINVLQSLKLIKDYQVVHMDLSPGNILVNQNYIPQLIDFGESYNKKICDDEDNYNPGFTLPFTFPQKFTRKEFNSKSDMFSYAVLLLYLVFKSVPYNPTQKLVKSLKNCTYLNKYFFAPQSVQYYGYRKIMIYLFSFIQKCMDPDLSHRPYPEWAIIIFKEIYFWLDQIQTMIV